MRTARRSRALEPLLDALASNAAQRDKQGARRSMSATSSERAGCSLSPFRASSAARGADWVEIFDVVRRMAAVDSSLAHLFAFHHLMVATLQFFGTQAQARSAMETTVRERFFWGNAVNPKDPRLRLRRVGESYRLDGVKSFCSGASDSDMLVISALDEEQKLKIAVIPTRRAGVRIHDDWDNMGQRQTDSGSVSFEDVAVGEDELLVSPGPLGSPFAALRPCLAQLILVTIYAGIARGALDEAVAYVRALAPKARRVSARDPFTPSHGRRAFRAGLPPPKPFVTRGAILSAGLGARRRDHAARTRRDRDRCRDRQGASARAALDVGSRMFDIMGARATTARVGLDRFWRNARTHTLHDPLDHKLKEIGDFVLNGVYPTPSFYS